MAYQSTTIADLAAEIEIPEGGTISRTIYRDDLIKVVLFGFDASEELSEHTDAVPAVLQFLAGSATLTLGENTMEVSPGSFVHMSANLPHSIIANEPTKMLLLLLKGVKPNG